MWYQLNVFFRYQKYYSKKGTQWSAYSLTEEKTYDHIPLLTRVIVVNRLQDPIRMNKRVVLAIDDPRRVFAVLAPTMPPPTVDHVAQKISRFSASTEDPDKTIGYSLTSN